MSPRPYVRKTVDVWRFYVHYGQGWEHETTELSREAMLENRKAYRENCPYPLRIVKGRERVEPAPAVNLESPAWDRAARDFTPEQ